MSRIAEGVHWLAITAWVGALWTVGLMVAPTLFHFVPDRMLAGSLAGRLFLYTAMLGLGCGGYVLIFRFARFGTHAFRQAFFWVGLVMVLLAVIGQFAVTPILDALRTQAFPRHVMETVLRDRFAVWHGVASGLYVIQCALGAVLVWLQPNAAR
jgi:hypothetical protein